MAALTQEFAGRHLRLNLIHYTEGTSTQQAVTYLSGPLGQFTAGSTLDLADGL